jgi:uncharacterized membrane protein
MAVPLQPSPSPGQFVPPRRRGRGLRWVFVGIGAAIVVVGIVLLTVALYPAVFGLSRPFGYPYGGGFLGVFLVLWGILLLVRVAWWTSRRSLTGGGGPQGRRFDPAIMAARQRYARGEITREQFEQLVHDLRRPPGPLP